MNSIQCTCNSPGSPCSLHKLVVFRNPDGSFSKIYTLRRIESKNDNICANEFDTNQNTPRNRQRSSSMPPLCPSSGMKKCYAQAQQRQGVTFANKSDQSCEPSSLECSESDEEEAENDSRICGIEYTSNKRQDADQLGESHTSQVNDHANRKYDIQSSASLEAFLVACLKNGGSVTERSTIRTETYTPKKSKRDAQCEKHSSESPSQRNELKSASDFISKCCCQMPIMEIHGFVTPTSHGSIDASKLMLKCPCETSKISPDVKNDLQNVNDPDKSTSDFQADFFQVAMTGLGEAMQQLQKMANSPSERTKSTADISANNETLSAKVDRQNKSLKAVGDIIANILAKLQETCQDDPNKSLQLTDIENKLNRLVDLIKESSDGETDTFNFTMQGLDQIVDLLVKSFDSSQPDRSVNAEELNRMLADIFNTKQKNIEKLEATCATMLRYLGAESRQDPNKSINISENQSKSKETNTENIPDNDKKNENTNAESPSNEQNQYPSNSIRNVENFTYDQTLSNTIKNTIGELNQAIGSIRRSKEASLEEPTPSESDLQNTNNLLKERIKKQQQQLDDLKAIMESIVEELRGIVDNKQDTTNYEDFAAKASSSSTKESTKVGENSTDLKLNKGEQQPTKKAKSKK